MHRERVRRGGDSGLRRCPPHCIRVPAVKVPGPRPGPERRRGGSRLRQQPAQLCGRGLPVGCGQREHERDEGGWGQGACDPGRQRLHCRCAGERAACGWLPALPPCRNASGLRPNQTCKSPDCVQQRIPSDLMRCALVGCRCRTALCEARCTPPTPLGRASCTLPTGSWTLSSPPTSRGTRAPSASPLTPTGASSEQRWGGGSLQSDRRVSALHVLSHPCWALCAYFQVYAASTIVVCAAKMLGLSTAWRAREGRRIFMGAGIRSFIQGPVHSVSRGQPFAVPTARSTSRPPS